MAVIGLQILEPAHNRVYTGVSPVARLRGQVVQGVGMPLYFAWYSSLFTPPATDANRTTLNGASDAPLDFTTALGVGSHVLTFTAKEQPGNDLAAITAVQHAGMAGGAPLVNAQGQPIVAAPCVIHVLTAILLAPLPGATLSRASLLLKAKAPVQWGLKGADGINYSPNPDYHKPGVNQLQYHWFFAPRGSPPRRSWEFITPVGELTFRPQHTSTNPNGPSIETLRNGTPHLDPGPYRLTLRVEDTQDPNQFHETAHDLTLT